MALASAQHQPVYDICQLLILLSAMQYLLLCWNASDHPCNSWRFGCIAGLSIQAGSGSSSASVNKIGTHPSPLLNTQLRIHLSQDMQGSLLSHAQCKGEYANSVVCFARNIPELSL